VRGRGHVHRILLSSPPVPNFAATLVSALRCWVDTVTSSTRAASMIGSRAYSSAEPPGVWEGNQHPLSSSHPSLPCHFAVTTVLIIILFPLLLYRLFFVFRQRTPMSGSPSILSSPTSPSTGFCTSLSPNKETSRLIEKTLVKMGKQGKSVCTCVCVFVCICVFVPVGKVGPVGTPRLPVEETSC